MDRATYADLEALPDHVIGELIDGELFASPRPRVLHARVFSVLGGLLGSHFDYGLGGQSNAWWFLGEPELHIGDDVLVPDIAAWRRTTLPQLPDAAAISTVPDWVCEISSPSTVRLDRLRKLPLYAQLGVSHAWVVDPEAGSLEVLRRQDEQARWLIVAAHGAEETVRAEPFEELELPLAQLFTGTAER